MIKNQDRSGYFGASDTMMVLTKNRNTKSFKQWWSVKMGEQESDFKGSLYTEAGNRYEHPILASISEEMNLDRQIIIEKLKLRVNYDGDLRGTIYEVKTHKSEKDFEITKAYWRQAQVEMYVYQCKYDDFKKLYIVSYPLYPDEYYAKSDVNVDFNRVKFSEIKYDKHFIKDEYLPHLKELTRYLKKGRVPF
ncbi:MAG: YqaJ viral recombinase family protein [Anaerovoracaceae bacterium]